MKWIYVNRSKGKSATIISFIVILIYQIIHIILSIIGQFIPIYSTIFNNIYLGFFNSHFSMNEFFIILILILLYFMIQAYFDGIIMCVLSNAMYFFAYFRVTNLGVIDIILNINELDIQFFLSIKLILFIFFALSLWSTISEIVIIIMESSRVDNFFNDLKNKRSQKEDLELISVELKEQDKSIELAEKMGWEKQNQNEWVDDDKNEIIYGKEEAVLMDDWIKMDVRKSQTRFEFWIVNSIIILFFGGLYAIIRWRIYDYGGTNYNYTITSLFFPMWSVLFYSFKSYRNYLRTWIFLIVFINVQLILKEFDIITAEGIFLISNIIEYSKFFFLGEFMSSYYNNMNFSELSTVIFTLIGIIMAIMLIIMIINYVVSVLRKKHDIEILISNKYLYFRKKSSFNDFSFFFDVIMLYIWPYNPESYYDLYKKFKYKKYSLKESWFWDYGRLSFENSINKVRKVRKDKTSAYFQLVILLVIGIISLRYLIGVLLITIAIFRLIKIYKNKEYTRNFDVEINFDKKKSEGSFFILDNYNQLQIYNILDDYVKKIPKINRIKRIDKTKYSI